MSQVSLRYADHLQENPSTERLKVSKNVFFEILQIINQSLNRNGISMRNYQQYYRYKQLLQEETASYMAMKSQVGKTRWIECP